MLLLKISGKGGHLGLSWLCLLIIITTLTLLDSTSADEAPASEGDGSKEPASDDASSPSEASKEAGSGDGASAEGRNADDDDDKDMNPGLTKHYEALYAYYKTLNDKEKEKHSDCKVGSDVNHANDPEHLHWGTLESFEYLAGMRSNDTKTEAEKMTKLPKLRVFLARIGYLREPGSLVFINKFTTTLKLTGCKDDSFWRMQGEKDTDLEFQQKGTTGKYYKDSAPNSFSYIHKYTCFKVDSKCSHIFYLITKPTPGLPLGLLVREDKKSEPEFQFPCTVPYCTLETCKLPGVGTPLNKRAYPPFKLSWRIPLSLKTIAKVDKDIITQQDYATLGKSNFESHSFKMLWEDRLKKSKEADLVGEENYKKASDKSSTTWDWVDGFEDKMEHKEGMHALQTRIEVERAHEGDHNGPYECILEDNNGVVSTPNELKGHEKEEFRGRAYLNVIPTELYFSYAVAAGCCVLVGIIICICPKKMEHDDGTPYSKDELVTPDELPPTGKEASRMGVQASKSATGTKAAESKAKM